MSQKVNALNTPSIFGGDSFKRWTNAWNNTGASTFALVSAIPGEVIHLMGFKLVNDTPGSTGELYLLESGMSTTSAAHSIWMGSAENQVVDFSPIGGITLSCGTVSNTMSIKTAAANSHGFAWGVISRTRQTYA